MIIWIVRRIVYLPVAAGRGFPGSHSRKPCAKLLQQWQIKQKYCQLLPGFLKMWWSIIKLVTELEETCDECHVLLEFSSLPPLWVLGSSSLPPRILLFGFSDSPQWVLGFSSMGPRILLNGSSVLLEIRGESEENPRRQ